MLLKHAQVMQDTQISSLDILAISISASITTVDAVRMLWLSGSLALILISEEYFSSLEFPATVFRFRKNDCYEQGPNILIL